MNRGSQRQRLSWWRETRDKIVASDPGLAQLQSASAAAVSMTSVLGVELLVFALAKAPAAIMMVSMLIGAVVAMMGSTALTGSQTWPKIRTAIFFPIAVGLGLLAGVMVHGHPTLTLVVFVAVMFLAVLVRKFGLAFFFYGFMTWMGYFFAALLQATLTMLPALMIAVVISTAWVLLLSITLLRTNPARTLRRTIKAFDATARSVVRASADLIETTHEEAGTTAARRRLNARHTQLADVALIVEARSAEPDAMAAGLSATRLRQHMIEAHHSIDSIAAAAVELAANGTTELSAAAVTVLERLSDRDDAGARDASRALSQAADGAPDTRGGAQPARHLAVAVLDFIGLNAQAAQVSGRHDPLDEFEPAVNLALGNLPGTRTVATDVPARGRRWNPVARLDITTRQAIQVALAGSLAILVGQLLSPTRYYWAVIAAFIMFTGTSTRAETFVKGFHRVFGTLLGLFASIGLANLTSGNVPLALFVIVASMFLGFYLIQRSYTYMILFVTIMIGQLYTVLHQYSAQLLVLRLEETVVGAVIGFLVALVVTPLSTRDTVQAARDNLLNALVEFLDTAASHLENPDQTPAYTLDALVRGVDDQARQLMLIAKPLTRPLVWGNSPSYTRHRLSLYATAARHARGIAVALRNGEGADHRDEAIAVCRALSQSAHQLTTAIPGKAQPATATALATADAALFSSNVTSDALAAEPLPRSLNHLQHLLHELAAPRQAVGPAARN